jgi:hypothetical protein
LIKTTFIFDYGCPEIPKPLADKETLKLRPCVRRFFPNFSFSRVSEIAVFQFRKYFGNVRAFQTCLDSQKLFLAKIRVGTSRNKSERVGTSRNEPYTEITENNEKMTFNSSRLDLRKLVPTQNSTRNFG